MSLSDDILAATPLAVKLVFARFSEHPQVAVDAALNGLLMSGKLSRTHGIYHRPPPPHPENPFITPGMSTAQRSRGAERMQRWRERHPEQARAQNAARRNNG